MQEHNSTLKGRILCADNGAKCRPKKSSIFSISFKTSSLKLLKCTWSQSLSRELTISVHFKILSLWHCTLSYLGRTNIRGLSVPTIGLLNKLLQNIIAAQSCDKAFRRSPRQQLSWKFAGDSQAATSVS